MRSGRLLTLAEAESALRASFRGAGEGLGPSFALLEQQLAALRSDPPPARLPEAALVAARSRLQAGEPVILRERFPVEQERAAHLLRRLARAVLADSRAVEDMADEFLAIALPRAFSDDGPGVVRAAEGLELEPDSAVAMLRESLKAELLRTSLPFTELAREVAPPRTRCPLCGGRPAAATAEGEALCRWCGLCFRLDPAACPACGSPDRLLREPQGFVSGARLVQCRTCGDVLASFTCPADPLVLSLHGILAAPLQLATRLGAGAESDPGFAVF